MSLEIVTLGCRLNLSESEELRSLLAGQGDLVVVNSCAVTSEAVRQTRRAIRRLRRDRPDARLLVTGCAAEVEREALAAMREVDGLIPNSLKLDPRAWNVPRRSSCSPATARHTRAFVQVQNGCDHACTFCIIPKGRGPSRSREMAAVVSEIRSQVDGGIREVVLTGVDLTDWGNDLPRSPRLGELVGAILSACPTLERLRLSSVDGIEIDPELFELLAGERRLMPHLHLSLQSGHDLVLKRMGRRHRRSDALALVKRLKERRPEIAIGADLIAGFPTETEDMHQASLSIVAELGVVHGHIFPYSQRPGTPAVRMPQVSSTTIRRRATELRGAVDAERRRWLTGMVGAPLIVLAEGDGTGHAENFARVRLPEGIRPGTVTEVTPTRLVEGLLE